MKNPYNIAIVPCDMAGKKKRQMILNVAKLLDFEDRFVVTCYNHENGPMAAMGTAEQTLAWIRAHLPERWSVPLTETR